MKRPSITAELAVMVRDLACRIPELQTIFHDPFARYFRGYRVFVQYLSNRIRYALCGMRTFSGGMGSVGVMCALCRHRLFEDIWTEAKSLGFSQLLLPGAGYDTKAIRNPSDSIFEIDHPATQRRKMRIVDARKLSVSSVFLPVDLSTSNATALLGGSSFRRDAPTLVLAEGLISYLHQARVRELLDELSGSAERVRLLFDYRTPVMKQPGAPAEARRWFNSFGRIGERYQSLWSPERIDDLLDAAGFTVMRNGSLSGESRRLFPCAFLPEKLDTTAFFAYAAKN